MNKSRLKKTAAVATASVLLAGSLIGHGVLAAGNKAETGEIPIMLPSLLQTLKDKAATMNVEGSDENNDIIAEGIDTASNDKINVIVQLSRPPVAVGKYAAKHGAGRLALEATESSIQNEQSAFLKAASAKGVSLKVNYNYNTVLNGMEVTVNANQIPQLAKIAGVKSVSPNYMYYPLASSAEVSTSVLSTNEEAVNYDLNPLKQIGVDEAWAKGYTGKGLKVGVLDTGVDYNHPDLKNAYVGGYNALGHDDDPYEATPSSDHPEGSYHGTHVSGTIVGRAENTSAKLVQKGVAYESDLHVYRVLGPDGGSSAQIIDGIEHAVKDGMDVINLSLGSDAEKGDNSPDSIALNNAVMAGVVAVVANGNSGDSGHYYYSMGSPASSQLAITVGAATSDSTHYDASATSSIDPSLSYALNLMSWKTDQENFHDLFGSEPIDAVYLGLGDIPDYKGKKVKDKIVFISRGKVSFEDKMLYARVSGAKAVIMFNGIESKSDNTVPNLSEDYTDREGMIGASGYMGDNFDYIPTFDMSGKEGRALAREIMANPGEPLTFTFGDTFGYSYGGADHIAAFSSRGPNTDGNYGIKPDLVAPGVNIFSTWPNFSTKASKSYDESYKRISGTSMATPHVAGLALLIKQAHPEYSPSDIRAALANTSTLVKNESGQQYDVYSQGAGRVDVVSAIDTPAIVESLDPITIYDTTLTPTIIESEASSISFGMIDSASETAVSKPVQLKNMSDKKLTYKVSVAMHPDVTSDPSNPISTPDVNDIVMTLDGLEAGADLTVAPNSTSPFTLSAKPKPDAVDGVYEGEIVLESAGVPTLHLPFVLHIGENSDQNDFPLHDITLTNSSIIRPNTNVDVAFTLDSDEMNYLELDVYSVNDQFIGKLGDIYEADKENHAYKTLASGKYRFEELDGSYWDSWTTDETGVPLLDTLEPGIYKLEMLAAHLITYPALVADDYSVAVKTIYVSAENGNDPSDGGGGTPNPGDGDGSTPSPTPGNGGGSTPSPTPGNEGGSTPSPSPGNGGGSTPSPAPWNGGGSYPTSPIVTPTPQPVKANETLSSVIQQGQVNTLLHAETTVQGMKQTASVTDDEVQKAIAVTGKSAAAYVIDITAAANATEVQLKLTNAQAKLFAASMKGSSIVLTWNNASVALPVSALANVPAGADFTLNIASSPDSKPLFNKQYPDASIVGTPYTFEANTVIKDEASPIILAADQSVKRAFLLPMPSNKATGALYVEGGIVYPVPAVFTPATDGGTIITISRPGFSTYAAASRHMAFTDINSSWAKDQTQLLADKFILNGTTSTTFSPKRNVTRAEFASILVRALGLNQAGTSKTSFSDVTGNEWFAKDVAAAYEAGLVQGAAGKFNPGAEISRQDLTVMLARAIKLAGVETSANPNAHNYADAAQFSSYARDSIQAVTDAGLMQGVEKQGSFYFQPSAATTREAVAKVMNDLLQAAHLI